MTELVGKINFNKKIMKNAIDSSYSTATDLADWLVKNLGYTFREAYFLTGKIVNFSIKKNLLLQDISLNELQKFDKKITNDIFTVLSSVNSMKSKKSIGGTAPQNVKKSIDYAIKRYL